MSTLESPLWANGGIQSVILLLPKKLRLPKLSTTSTVGITLIRTQKIFVQVLTLSNKLGKTKWMQAGNTNPA